MDKLGIDIAKLTFDVCLLKQQQRQWQQFNNSPAGFKQLKQWLAQQGVDQVHACMEATSVYYEGVATCLYEAGHQVSVVNPLRIKAFRKSRLRRTKNDKQDAFLIAQFCQQQQPALWQPLSPAQSDLQALVRHRQALLNDRQQQRNRLESCRTLVVAASLERMMATLNPEIEAIEQAIADHIDQHPDLKNQYDLLLTIPGLGAITAAQLLAEMPFLAEYASAKQAAADAGLSPGEWSSGTSIHAQTRLCKIGKARVRKLLFFPALSALRHNPLIQALQVRLLARGKPKMVIVGAAMRKLLHIAYGVLKNKIPFDPHYVN